MFQGKCYNCGNEFTTHEDNVPHYTKARKYDWHDLKCGKCGFDNKYARFSKDSDLLFVIPAN